MTNLLTEYTLNTKIRETRYAELHRGYRNVDGVPVVVKLLRNERPSPLELARLRHEHGVLQSLDAPHVVKSLGLERHGHGLALVLEDVGEESLDRLIRSGHLDLKRSLELAVALARTLAVVHGHRVIHKDIKPHHFFIRPGSQELVLVDFGIATHLSQQVQSVAPVGELEGTLAYIAPEQTGRMNRVVDWRSDLYSLGVTLYELFTGRLPFESSDALELVHSHIARMPLLPQSLRCDLPSVLSDIIMKLLAKAAEERYQSAEGLQHDLQRSLDELTLAGHVAPFVLRERDRSGELSIPQKLYGRQEELTELLSTLDRTRRGGKELLLLSGHAGVGKTALVNDLRRRLTHGGHYFASGKFDFLGRSVPYAPIANAFRGLIRSVLAESPAVMACRRESLLDALGPNGQLLIELVPELELVIGPQPSVPPLGPSESQHRFELVFLNFLRVFATHEHQLVLFLDDLQWADAGSLRLLEHVLTSSSIGHVLVIGAYRKNEVNAEHPLVLTLNELQRAGMPVQELMLQPLELTHVTEMLCEALDSPPSALGELAQVLLDKTSGNPFFLNQFLSTLHRDGLLVYDRDQQAWRWNLKEVQARLATENVVDFMLARLRELPAETQSMLRFAACIGHQFDGETLATVSQRSRDDVKVKLWDAVQQGLLLPLDGNYQYASGSEESASDQACPVLNATYQFLHDRVHQAAYSLISADQQAEVHLTIGRLLLERVHHDPIDRDLFEVTDHLNRGRALMADPSEREELARLNLAAARRARDAAAPGSAVHYLSAGLALLEDGAFARYYDLAWPAHLLKAECEYLTGNLGEAMRLLKVVEQHARTTLEKVAARRIEIMLITKTGQLQLACAKTVESARLLGVMLPPVEDRGALGAAIGPEFAAYQASLAGQSVESLVDLPPMTDSEQLARVETVAKGVPAAYGSMPELHVLLVLKGVQLLRQATAPLAGFFYEQYAIVHSVITGDLDTAFRYGQLGIELAKRANDPGTSGQVRFLFGGFTSHWREHISHGLELLRSGVRLCLEGGDQLHAAYCSSVTVLYRLYAGENLDEVEASIQTARELTDLTGDVVNRSFCAICQQTIAALKGKTKQFGFLDSDDFSEASFETSVPVSALPFYGTAKTMMRYLAGRSADALKAADQWELPPAMFFHGEHALYRALAAADLARNASLEDRPRWLDRLRSEAKIVEGWAKSAPANHAHRSALVRAELATLEGNQADAIDLFDQAIRLAHDNGFLHQEALANELACRFHASHHRRTVASAYLAEALYAYRRWGASAKTKDLQARYSDLLPDPARLFSPSTATPLTPITTVSDGPVPLSEDPESSTLRSQGRLDLATAVRATEAIATELVMDRLWERLMRALLEHAGAQRGCVVLDHGGVLRIEATISIDPNTVRLGLSQDLEESQDVPATLIQYVARTREAVVLADATHNAQFGNDPYIARSRPKSVLCVGMLQRGKLTGVLYLENNTATDAFSPARTELLQFLAAQAAVAFENAKLYGELNRASDELRRANESLESQVAQRTTELRRTLAELWSEMDLARKIQTVLLPKQPRLSDYEMAAVMVPAESVGGDYYDVVEADDRSWILIGDVSGHGVPAGLVMMMIQTAVRTIVLTSPHDRDPLSPAVVLSRANRAVRENLEQISQDQYMTIAALELRRGIVRYSGLHQDILVHRAATNTVERLETRGMWIGIEDDISPMLQDDSIELNPGDTILLFTDGITESLVNGRMLETSGLLDRFRALAAQRLDPAAIVKGVIGPITGQALNDDVTVMAIRYVPAEARTKRQNEALLAQAS